MSRWKHQSAAVTIGENSQSVRALTHKERSEFAQTSKKIREGQMQATELPAIVAKMGCIDPPLTDDELEDMPADLLDACVAKILSLTGLKDEAAAPGDAEKKGS